jgi:pimeloyl-ACP methyl ester carboxylesterase
MPEIAHRTVRAGDIDVHVLEAGDPGDPPVLLLHGFPELAYSWRHQLPALAAAGHHTIAPDLRGFGGTTVTTDPTDYDVTTLSGDVLALLDALGLETVVLVGHDWGADLAWKAALLHPERFTAVAGLSVPYVPRAPAPPVPILREHLGEDFYIVWFQEPGVADEVLARDVRRTLCTTRVWTAGWAQEDEDPPRPAWLSEEDLAVYVDAFTATGFTGGLNLYRNIDRNWEQLAAVDDRRIDQPAFFLTGTRDPVTKFMPHQAMDGHVTDLRQTVFVEGAGHWVQQERPDEVNAALLGWLAEVTA